jgi:hypothetical protein
MRELNSDEAASLKGGAKIKSSIKVKVVQTNGHAEWWLSTDSKPVQHGTGNLDFREEESTDGFSQTSVVRIRTTARDDE